MLKECKIALVGLMAKISHDFALKKAKEYIEKALLEDNEVKLKESIENALILISEEELKSIYVFCDNHGRVRGNNIKWTSALVSLGYVESVAYILRIGLVKPSESVEFQRSFKDVCWSKEENGFYKAWIEDAKFNELWKWNSSSTTVVCELNGINWLKRLYMEALSAEEDRKRAGWTNQPPQLNKKIVISNNDEYYIYFKEDDQGKIIEEKRGVKELLKENPHSSGPAADAYVAFVELGWCSSKDVYEFHKWIEGNEIVLPLISHGTGICQWYRRDAVKWAENGMLKMECGITKPKLIKPVAL